MSDHRIVHIEVPVAEVARNQSFYVIGLFTPAGEGGD